MKLNIVPARTGIEWVKLGIQTFFKQPLALSTLCFAYVGCVIAFASIPLVGPVILLCLIPAGTLGLMAATEQAAQGRIPTPLILLSAFRAGKQRARAMMVLGFIYFLAAVVVALLTWLLMPAAPGGIASSDPAMQKEAAKAYLLASLVQLPIAIAFWHAPALVHWHNVSPMKSLFFSLVAWIRNFRAFLVYVAAWFVLFVGVILVIGLIGSVFEGEGAKLVAIPLVLVTASMFFTSLYFTFRDSFVATPDTEAQPPGEPT